MRIYAEGGYWNSHAMLAVPLHSFLWIVHRSGSYNFLKIGLFNINIDHHRRFCRNSPVLAVGGDDDDYAVTSTTRFL